MSTMKEILIKIKDLFTSPRFMSFYWQAGSVFAISFLNLLSENLADTGLPSWAVIGLGLAIAQATKALNNLKQGKAAGFTSK